MTGTLNQIVAVEKGEKSRAKAAITEAYKLVQKPVLFNGFVATYQKNDEAGEDLPQEKQHVQANIQDIIGVVRERLGELFALDAKREWTNSSAGARASIVVRGKTILADVPVTFLLFLEKQLVDLRTFVAEFPVLDSADNWSYDADSGLHKADVVRTHRTKKTSRALVLYPATAEHPAQTQLVTEDIIAGYWSKTKHSGAASKTEISAALNRIDQLTKAVKSAREMANMCPVAETPDVSAILNYVFEGS